MGAGAIVGIALALIIVAGVVVAGIVYAVKFKGSGGGGGRALIASTTKFNQAYEPGQGLGNQRLSLTLTDMRSLTGAVNGSGVL